MPVFNPPYTPLSAEDICRIYMGRKNAQGPDIERMRQIQQVMNNDIVLPLPELSQEERPAVANLAQQGMSQLARRIASVDPTQWFPSLDPGNETADDAARDIPCHRSNCSNDIATDVSGHGTDGAGHRSNCACN